MSDADLRGKFIWHELMAPNAHTAADFYSSVLPWTTELSSVPGYTLWMSDSVGVAGLMPQPATVRESGTPPSWLVYVGVPDVDASAHSAQRFGGKLLKAPTDIPGIGRFAVLSDPQGAAFAVFTPAMTPPRGAVPGALGRFSWHELATIDPESALSFYAELFGWKRGPAHDMGTAGHYQLIEHAGVQIGGLYRLQDPSKPPQWLSYVQVEHLDETLASVRTRGGSVVRGPHVVPGGDRVAHIIDPQGGAIALHERSPAEQATSPKRRAARRKTSAHTTRPRRAPARAKTTVKRPATRGRKRTARPAAKRSVRGAVKTTAGRVAKRAAKRPAKRVATAAKKGAVRRAPARQSPGKRPAPKTRAATSTARPTRRTRSVKRPARRR